jgi:hypothetical protein
MRPKVVRISCAASRGSGLPPGDGDGDGDGDNDDGDDVDDGDDGDDDDDDDVDDDRMSCCQQGLGLTVWC